MQRKSAEHKPDDDREHDAAADRHEDSLDRRYDHRREESSDQRVSRQEKDKRNRQQRLEQWKSIERTNRSETTEHRGQRRDHKIWLIDDRPRAVHLREPFIYRLYPRHDRGRRE